MKRLDLIAFVDLLFDMFGPLCAVPHSLADVGEKIHVTKDAIISFKERHITKMHLTCFLCIIYVIATLLYDIRDYVVFYSHGPRLRQFFKDHKVAGSYKGEAMTGMVTEGTFHTTKLKPLAEKILTTLGKRCTDVSEDVVAATRIANLRQWPPFSMKEDVTGRVSSSRYKNLNFLLHLLPKIYSNLLKS